MGKLADLVSTTVKHETPLAADLARFLRFIIIFGFVVAIVFLVALCILRPEEWVNNIAYSIGLFVADVPEGLLPTFTVALALVAYRMKQKNVLVKGREAVDTLGCTSTICTDKTGTLTMNRMTVSHLWTSMKLKKAIEISELELEGQQEDIKV
jgi:sodium/potassium-transporting ATPase subunit alpha